MVPPIEDDLAALGSGHPVTVVDLGAGDAGVIIEKVPLSPGWNRSETTILIRVPRAYPQAQLDMFFAEAGLRLASGAMPSNASLISLAGREWLQFSWHPRKWSPGVDTLTRYLGFVKGRFKEAR